MSINILFPQIYFRQIIAYKNLIEALEHISIAMILAVSFLLTGYMEPNDYREFIRTHSLSYEHLISAQHFLQREAIFDTNTEAELFKWYNNIFNIFSATTIANKNADLSNDARHGLIINSSLVVEKNPGVVYFNFMNEVILKEIKRYQQKIRQDVR